MLKWLFKKAKEHLCPSCTNCLHYGCVKSNDKLNADKTITKGRLQYEFCLKGNFHLSDHKTCDMYKELCEGDKRSARILPPVMQSN